MRQQLIAELRQKGIEQEAILQAFWAVPRHLFIDSAFTQHAYQDKAFSIGEGQTISQPFTVAFQTHLLDLKPGMKVLEIGTGSGFQSCILLRLGAKLFSIERNQLLYQKAKKRLSALGYTSANLIWGDGTKGLPNSAPFHRILVTAGAPIIPRSLIEQLAPDGKLVIPVGDDESQEMLRITKISDKKLKKESFGGFSFVKLLGEEGWKP